MEQMTGAAGPGNASGWRVFVSHTSELQEFPAGASYVGAVKAAISACGHVIVDMAEFPAADQPPAELCIDRVRRCDVYVGVLGVRYGSPVRDRPQVSYTELEFEAATEAGLDRLMFLLDTSAADVGIPLSALIDHEFGARQEAFRSRVRDSELVSAMFTDLGTLGQVVERSLRELAEKRRRPGAGSQQAQGAAVVVAGEIPQQPLGSQPRPELLAALEAPGEGSGVRALTGMRGVGKTHLAAAYARAKLAAGWRLVAWVNAEGETGLLAGLAEVAAALGLAAGNQDERVAGRAVRHRLEADGDRCLLVFENAADVGLLRPFIPAAGAARVIITSNQRSMAALGTGIPMDVFSEQEALTFLAARTGQADVAGARVLAEELGWLPLALAQAAAVIASEHLPYATYLDRLRRLPVSQMLTADQAGQYPRGAAAAILLSLEYVSAGDDGSSCAAVMGLLAVLSAAGVRRPVIHAAGQEGLAAAGDVMGGLPPDVVDRVLGRLAGVSLLTFSVDGASVTVHRLVMRVIRESLVARDVLASTCVAAAAALKELARSLEGTWHQDRLLVRDLVDQIMALSESADRCPASDDLTRQMVSLRTWALRYLNALGDSTAQAIVIGEQLLAEQASVLGPDHPSTLTTSSNLASAYQDAGRTSEAVTMHEQALAATERVLGPDHPDTLESRNGLASAYLDAGRTSEAITMHEQTLAATERILGPAHRGTLTVRNNLGGAYWTAGRISDAIAMEELTLAASERVLGPDHPDTAAVRNNLAGAYQAAGRTSEPGSGDARPADP
jgi:hypothetical protein